MTDYTIGDWKVSDLVTDTLTTAKNISVPDLSWVADYTKVLDGPEEAKVANTTGPDLISHENVRFARSEVANIYTGVNSDSAMVMPMKKGVQVMCELSSTYRAANKVSGNEYDLPCKGRIVLRFPASTCVTQALVTDLLIRTIASAYGTGAVTAQRMMDMAMGALLPYKKN